jgi:hypothetical protein
MTIIKAFTDYPFVELGDTIGKIAPIRECVVKSFDDDKYCRIVVEGFETEIKSGYLYKTSGRLGDVENIGSENIPIVI